MGSIVLNQETLLLVQICITLLTTGLLVMAAMYTDAAQEQRSWALGNVIATAGLAMSMVDSLPQLLNSVLAYGVSAGGLGLLLRGLRTYCQRSLSWRWVALIVAGALLLAAWFTYGAPNPRARLTYISLYFGLLIGLCGATLLRHGDLRGVGASVAGFTTLALAMCVRGVYLLFHANQAGDRTSLALRGVMLILPLAQVCISFGLILMVTRRYAERLRQLSLVDSMTGALNRAGLEAQGRRVAQRTLRAGRSLAVIMLDVDHFKVVNDTYGHPAGDAVLRELARQIRLALRPMDLQARYGGEEFVLVLDGIALSDALQVAERLRASIENTPVRVEAFTIRYTVSMGVVSSDQHGYDLQELIATADVAMYAAKRAGRNRVVAG